MTRRKTETGPGLHPGFQPVAHGVWLDHRLALVHPGQGWMAVADLHFGYAECRRLRGYLIPEWGCGEIGDRLHALLNDHQPRRLILAGDVMDGAANGQAALQFLDRLRASVRELVVLTGNHDRPALLRAAGFLATHEEPGFYFHHGHQNPVIAPGVVEITGHQHPAVRIRDGAGLHLKLPALIRERGAAHSSGERWILPSFSPWAAGGEYHSERERLATWVCAPGRVWSLPKS